MTFIKMTSHSIQQTVDLFHQNQHFWEVFHENYVNCIINIHLKTLLVELLQLFKGLVRWKIQKVENTVFCNNLKSESVSEDPERTF